MNTIDRRAFLGYSSGVAALALLPLAGCGGGDPYPAVSRAGMGPVAAAVGGRQFQALGTAHTLVITESNGLQKRFGGVGLQQGKLNFPAGVAVLNGLAYVVETGNHRVQVFDGAGAVVRVFGEGELLYPGGIAAGNDEIFVADSRHSRIVGYTPAGRVTRVLGAGVLSAPRGMDVVEDGILVADPGLRKVLKLGFDGQVQMEFGANWVLPWDVVTDGSFIYVADVSKNELGVTTLAGDPLNSIPLATAPVNVWFRGETLYVASQA